MCWKTRFPAVLGMEVTFFFFFFLQLLTDLSDDLETAPTGAVTWTLPITWT